MVVVALVGLKAPGPGIDLLGVWPGNSLKPLIGSRTQPMNFIILNVGLLGLLRGAEDLEIWQFLWYSE